MPQYTVQCADPDRGVGWQIEVNAGSREEAMALALSLGSGGTVIDAWPEGTRVPAPVPAPSPTRSSRERHRLLVVLGAALLILIALIGVLTIVVR